MADRKEVQSQHAEATRRVVLCGELGTRRDVSEKRPPVSMEQHLAGREHWSHHQEQPLLSSQEGESKSWGLSGGLLQSGPHNLFEDFNKK